MLNKQDNRNRRKWQKQDGLKLRVAQLHELRAVKCEEHQRQ